MNLRVITRYPWSCAIFLISLVGFCIAIYLTAEHYAAAPLVCSVNGVVDCASALKSKYSVVPGTNLPVTIPGMLWFVAMVALESAYFIPSLRQRIGMQRLKMYEIIWSLVGLLSVVYFITSEIQLHKICSWCTGVHICIFVIFILIFNKPAPVFETSKKAGQLSTGKVLASTSAGVTSKTAVTPKKTVEPRKLQGTARTASYSKKATPARKRR
jgi:uncharacterized membrane protein